MASFFSLRGLASRFVSRSFNTSPLSVRLPECPSARSAWHNNTILAPESVHSPRAFSTSSTLAAKAVAGKKGGQAAGKSGGGRSKRKNEEKQDPKVVNLLRQLASLSPNRIPAPLRMGRNRYLRHWTIHRAWLLYRRRERRRREAELMRQYQGMRDACEELRRTAGPGTREEGYLYRVAMEKKGVYGAHGIPIEYARAQTETPATEAWKHDWKRPRQ